MARNRPIKSESSIDDSPETTSEVVNTSEVKSSKKNKKIGKGKRKKSTKQIKEKPVKKVKSVKEKPSKSVKKNKKVKSKGPKKKVKNTQGDSESKVASAINLAKQGYAKTPRVIGWLKRTGSNILGVVDDVIKGSHHHILTKQLLMAGGAIVLALFSWNLSSGAYHKNLKVASYDETIFNNHNSLDFSTSGTSVTSSKLYKSADGKTAYLPLVFSNGTPAQMPLDASQMKTDIKYAGSVLESSKLSAEMVGLPALDSSMFYVYVIHKPDNKYANVSSTVTTTVTANLTQQTETDDSGKLKATQPDVLNFTVDLGSKKAKSMDSNDDTKNIKQIYSDVVFKDQISTIINDSQDALKANDSLYNQSVALLDTLNKADVKVPATPQFATKEESGNVYDVNFKSNLIKGYFSQDSYDSLKRQYLGQGYTDMSNRFNVGMDVNQMSNPQYNNGKTVPQSDTTSLNAMTSLSNAWSSIISNKSKAYVDGAQSLFTLQYQYDFNINKKSVADNEYFKFSAK